MFRDAVLAASGTLRASYEAVDWAATPLGPMASWSPALRNAVALALSTEFPITLFWGPQFILVYNAAYVELIADKHPAALGAPARDVFPEAWDTIGPMMRRVLAGEGATWVEDAPVPLLRHGRLEEAYFTFSYSPVRGAGGAIEGVLDIATETTRDVIDRRRLELLGRLREVLGSLDVPDAVADRALPVLRADAADLPAVDIRMPDRGPAPEDPGGDRIARFPLGTARPDRARPVLEVALSEHLAPDARYLGFLRLIASTLGQALDRIDARETQRGVAEALQLSLLTRPPQPPGLAVAVRYRPAARQVQLGGDWYDAFAGPDGDLRLAVGDVTGHDRRAVAAMAQVRNLLRGVSYTLPASPAGVLRALDAAMTGLAVGQYATAILARVERDAAGVTVRWSNAGHPPPVLVGADGGARLLATDPEPLLGLVAGTRTDHTVALAPGQSLVLYTDGLVERRRVPLQERLEWLAGLLDGHQDLSAEALCDHVLAQIDEDVDDDVALLVLRVDS